MLCNVKTDTKHPMRGEKGIVEAPHSPPEATSGCSSNAREKKSMSPRDHPGV